MKLEGRPVYKFFWIVGKAFLAPFIRLRQLHCENLPAQGAAVLCPNHFNALDFWPVMLGTKRFITVVAKEETLKNGFFRKAIKGADALTVKRGEADIDAIKAMMKSLKDGHPLLLFPEGTRNHDRSRQLLLPLQNGAAMLALKMNVPLIPVWISGKYNIFTGLKVTYGAPVDLDEFRAQRRPDLDAATLRLREAMLALEAEER